MADYRDLAAALGGGYGQDTGGITPDTLITLKNGKKATAGDLLGMLKAIGSGSLSNLESLVRGGVAQIPGTAGDLEGLARMGINKAFGAGGVNVNPTPVLPTTSDILGMMPLRVTQARPETAGMEELGTMIAPGLAKAAAPVGKGYLSLLGNEINAGMTGQPTRSIIGQITPKPLQLDVYHGTPHSFERFDASKIGTGEGAQAYGHGIYVAENPKVAEGYRDTLAYKAFDLKPEAEKLGLNLPAGTRGEFMRQVQANKPPEVLAKQLQNANIAARDLPQDKLAELFRSYQEKGGGNLYKADLPDEMIPKMLDWDKPLSQQSDFVKQAFNYQPPELPKDLKVTLTGQSNPNWKYSVGGFPAAPTEEKAIENALKSMKSSTDYRGKTGQELYKEIASTFANSKNPLAYKEASDELSKLGITGIRYLDEGSRNVGKGTSNFVIFPSQEQNIKILERNAEKTTK